MRRIPKTAFFYWGAPVLPYIRYMCFKSFRQYNPDWKVVLFTPTQLTTTQSWTSFENKQTFNTEDYSDRLNDLGVHVCKFDMEAIGFPNTLSEVLKSDIIRLHLLATVGGLWSDSDIIYFRPLSHALPQTDHNAFFCFRRGGPTQENTPKNGPRYHSIGFMAGAPGNQYFNQLFAGVSRALNTDQYQSAGSTYYKTLLNDDNIDSLSDIFNIPIDTVYPSRAVPGLWVGPTKQYVNHLHAGVIGFHWYAGHPVSGDMQNKITEKTYGQLDNVICWLIDKVNDHVVL